MYLINKILIVKRELRGGKHAVRRIQIIENIVRLPFKDVFGYATLKIDICHITARLDGDTRDSRPHRLILKCDVRYSLMT